MQPDLIERTDGDWLALFPAQSALRIAVEGRTPDEAAARFASASDAWARLLTAADTRVLAEAVG